MGHACMSTKTRCRPAITVGCAVFNYGRPRCKFKPQLIQRDVLLRRYHIDGLRVDAVTSMLYLDYARKGANTC